MFQQYNLQVCTTRINSKTKYCVELICFSVLIKVNKNENTKYISSTSTGKRSCAWFIAGRPQNLSHGKIHYICFVAVNYIIAGKTCGNLTVVWVWRLIKVAREFNRWYPQRQPLSHTTVGRFLSTASVAVLARLRRSLTDDEVSGSIYFCTRIEEECRAIAPNYISHVLSNLRFCFQTCVELDGGHWTNTVIWPTVLTFQTHCRSKS